MVSKRAKDSPLQSGDKLVSASEAPALSPSFLYIHYLTDRHLRKYPLYLFQLEGMDVSEALKRGIDAILDGKAQPVPIDTDGTQHWRVLSYTAFVLKSDERIYHVKLEHDGRNHSFEYSGELEDYRNCSAVYFINKRRRRGGRPLREGDSELFNWWVYHRPAATAENAKYYTHENAGSNTGP